MTKQRSRQAAPLLDLPEPDSLSEDAVRYFQSRPHFASSQLWMRKQLALVDEKSLLSTPPVSPARQELVLKRLDARAGSFARLVSTTEMQRAFITVLGLIMREAWRELTGYYPEVICPCSDLTWSFADQIWSRWEYWVGKTYEQIDPAEQPFSGSANAEEHLGGTGPARWEDITVFFISDLRVRMEIGREHRTANYAELGFMDKRSKKPNGAWLLLRSLAESNGILKDTRKVIGTWASVEKRIQLLRKTLRRYFGVQIDPLPFTEGGGYRARMKIGCAPSFKA